MANLVSYKNDNEKQVDDYDSVLSDFEDLNYDYYNNFDSYVLFNPKIDTESDTVTDVLLELLDAFGTSEIEKEPSELSRTISQSHRFTSNNSVSPPSMLKWYLSNIYLLNDNIASWNFDSNPNKNNLNFYGDELFKYFDHSDYRKLNEIRRLINVRYLTERP